MTGGSAGTWDVLAPTMESSKVTSLMPDVTPIRQIARRPPLSSRGQFKVAAVQATAPNLNRDGALAAAVEHV
jgi:hypothetical protein